jgi:putative ABC transport system ATP-binding protein
MDNVLPAQHWRRPSDPARVRQVLEGSARDRRHAHPHTLSHGQAQRVAVAARSSTGRPPPADEPTPTRRANAAQVLALLREQAAAVGATLVIATHDGRIRDAVPHRLELKAGAPEAVR